MKVLILFLSQTTFLVMTCLAQNNGPYVYLTNYTVTSGSNTIGYVKAIGEPIKSVTIEGEDAKIFKIGKNNELMIKRDPSAMRQEPYKIVLKVKTSAGEASREFQIVGAEFIRNKVIAHRGAWKNTNVPENSIAALKHAIMLGCEGSEFDVHMSADSLPVVNHDSSIHGVSIAKTNSAELLTTKLSNGEPLPTLENYLKAGMTQTRTKLILEIKPSELGRESSIALARKVVTLVEKLQAQAWVDYISFDYDACKEVMKVAPYARVAYLRGDKTPAELAADHFFGLDYNFNVLQKNPDWIKESKSRKLTINVWTVNEQSSLEYFLKEEVDFITTNEPELLLSMIK